MKSTLPIEPKSLLTRFYWEPVVCLDCSYGSGFYEDSEAIWKQHAARYSPGVSLYRKAAAARGWIWMIGDPGERGYWLCYVCFPKRWVTATTAASQRDLDNAAIQRAAFARMEEVRT